MSVQSTVEVRVPNMLRAATAGEKVVAAEGDSVGQVLTDLARRYPGVGDSLFGPDGELRQFVNVYVNDEDIRYLGRLETKVESGDTISILPAVAGG
jgi:molybdopterin synthase sulfur carrier subunit